MRSPLRFGYGSVLNSWRTRIRDQNILSELIVYHICFISARKWLKCDIHCSIVSELRSLSRGAFILGHLEITAHLSGACWVAFH